MPSIGMSARTRLFIAVVATMGAVQLGASALSWREFDSIRFPVYLALAALSSLVRLKRAGHGISLSLPFVLLSIVDLTVSEAVLIGCVAVLIHSLRSTHMRASALRVLVAVAIQATVIATGGFVLGSLLPPYMNVTSVRFLVGAISLFVANTLPVVIAVRLSSKERLGKLWQESYSWSLPYYLVCGALAIVAHRGQDTLTLEASLVVLPTILLAYRYYRSQRATLESQQDHASQMAALHIRAIEGLALAVEAKDNLNTRGHLRRVQVYSLAIGKEIGLSETELEALHAGALLHDIGKLAVPDHILSKPGKLTAEEFAKMKVHPLVGAEIVEQVQFPYPVAPIVRAHHEKWNGSGYPYGLKGEEIPLPARILTTVDCLDALTSDREYRKGVPLEEAMEYIRSESGTSFDPAVVEVLDRLYANVAEEANTKMGQQALLSAETSVDKGLAPDAGLGLSATEGDGGDAPSFLSAIAEAHREESLLRTMTGSVAVLEMHEVLPRIQRLLEGMIPHDSMVFFARRANVLQVEFSSGIASEEISSVEIAMGDGLTGWVAQNRQPVVNGNPSVDPGVPPIVMESLQSALSTPLEGSDNLAGVLTLYRTGKDAFTKDELRILNTVTPNIASAVENALKYRETQVLAKIDSLTGLPGAELFLQTLGEELARGRRMKQSLCVLHIELCEKAEAAGERGKDGKDKLIAVAGKGIKKICREYDRVGRLDGASFGVALPAMKPNHLSAMLDRLEALIASAGGDEAQLRIGGAFYPEDGDGAKHLLALAQRRSNNPQPEWTESIRAMAESVARRSRSGDRSRDLLER